MVEPGGLLGEGHIGHRWDWQGGLGGDLEGSSLSNWAEGDVSS